MIPEKHGIRIARVVIKPFSAALCFAALLIHVPSALAHQHDTTQSSFLPTVSNKIPSPRATPANMTLIPGGEFSMGCSDPRTLPRGGHEAMEDCRPIHRVYVDAFWMDKTDVTNKQFARFVRATGYKTVAEHPPDPKDFPGVNAKLLVPGSLVFAATETPVPLNDYSRWWHYVPGANWRHPTGPGSNLRGRERYPVVQIAYVDAAAYAAWAHKRLPTEAEWEFAARGGLTGQAYAWGNDIQKQGKWMANTHQGHFPDHDSAEDGFAGIAPVAQYPPNPYGLYDITGNVWQWTADWYDAAYYQQLGSAHVIRNPTGPSSADDPDEPGVAKRVQRGGSFLCTEQYCTRYLVGTRGKAEVSSATNHVSFRCVRGRQTHHGREGKAEEDAYLSVANEKR